MSGAVCFCFHLHSAERGTAVESTDSLVLSVAPWARRRVSRGRRLMSPGLWRLFRPARSTVRRARTGMRIESWKFLVPRVAQCADQLAARGDAELPEQRGPRQARPGRPVTAACRSAWTGHFMDSMPDPGSVASWSQQRPVSPRSTTGSWSSTEPGPGIGNPAGEVMR